MGILAGPGNEPGQELVDISGYLAEVQEQERQLGRLFDRSEALVIFDVGACEGEDSIRYATLFPRARVFAFEPLPGNQALIEANFAKYGLEGAELERSALSDRQGTATFHVSSGTPPELFRGENWNYGNKSGSLLAPASEAPMFGWLKFEQLVEVPCRTFDDFCSSRGLSRVDFVHMDVQGAELLVLAGARKSMSRIVTIWLEVSDAELYRGQGLRADVERLMWRSGFGRCAEVRRGAEGDQFYVNLRFPRVWRWWLAAKATSAGTRFRSGLGRWRRRILNRPDQA